MIDDDIRALRDALADGPTPGPWVDDMESYRSASDVTIYSEARGELDYVVNIGYCGNTMEDGAYIAFDASAINARYIAACSPDRISHLLAEVEQLREALGEANAEAEHFERLWYLRGDEIERLLADAAIGEVVWRYIDRMRDACETNPADRILAEFVAAVSPLVDVAIDAA